jgi:hypothetical protein
VGVRLLDQELAGSGLAGSVSERDGVAWFGLALR